MAAMVPATPPTAEEQAQKDADIRALLTNKANPRGIPTVRFIDDVDTFMKTNELTTEVLIGAFTELHQKYKMMEQQLVRQKASLKNKIPDIENTLDLVTILKEKQDEEEEMTVNYPLCDTVHARANVNTNGTVCLWLGANVMVEYSYDEALDMLEKNLTSSRAKLQETSEDQDHLKDQSITLEVVMARVFNHNVKTRRLEKEAAEAAAKAKSIES